MAHVNASQREKKNGSRFTYWYIFYEYIIPRKKKNPEQRVKTNQNETKAHGGRKSIKKKPPLLSRHFIFQPPDGSGEGGGEGGRGKASIHRGVGGNQEQIRRKTNLDARHNLVTKQTASHENKANQIAYYYYFIINTI